MTAPDDLGAEIGAELVLAADLAYAYRAGGVEAAEEVLGRELTTAERGLLGSFEVLQLVRHDGDRDLADVELVLVSALAGHLDLLDEM